MSPPLFVRMWREASIKYRNYVLIVLMLVYLFNFLDRQILAILAERIKADLEISDSEMGFLLGTSFAVFYALFGIPIGRAADVVNRKNLISVGLLLWSLLTCLSGFARSFASLAVLRMGVGVGEASASPAAYSLLYDYFPEGRRATAIAVYSSGIFLGAGLGLAVGGFLLEAWDTAFPDPALAPLGLSGWHAAFLIVGAPGLVLTAWVWSLREPPREGRAQQGADGAKARNPVAALVGEVGAFLPILSLAPLVRSAGVGALVTNAAIAAGVAAAASFLGWASGDWMQWGVMGLGVYCVATWVQRLHYSDPAAFAMIFRCRTLLLANLGFSGCFFMTAAALAWLAVFFQRSHGASVSEAGLVLGLSYAVAGFVGVCAGGWTTDILTRKYGARARLHFASGAAALAAVCLAAAVLVVDKWLAYAGATLFNLFSAMYISPGASNVNDMLVARFRAVGSSVYIVFQVFLGTAMGPYVIGAISDALVARGLGSDGALRGALCFGALAVIPSLILLHLASSSANRDQASREERAANHARA